MSTPPVLPFGFTGETPATPPLTANDRSGWHAVGWQLPPIADDQTTPWGRTYCGTIAQITPRVGAFDPATLATNRACLECVWWHAIYTNTVDAQLARLGDGAGRELAVAIARAILAAAPDDCEVDHPATVDLLAAVTAHAGESLVGEECAEGSCEHRGDGIPCPTTVGACRACSVQAGGWAGEWEGQYRPEATVIGPCSLMRAMAAHYGIPIDTARTA